MWYFLNLNIFLHGILQTHHYHRYHPFPPMIKIKQLCKKKTEDGHKEAQK